MPRFPVTSFNDHTVIPLRKTARTGSILGEVFGPLQWHSSLIVSVALYCPQDAGWFAGTLAIFLQATAVVYFCTGDQTMTCKLKYVLDLETMHCYFRRCKFIKKNAWFPAQPYILTSKRQISVCVISLKKVMARKCLQNNPITLRFLLLLFFPTSRTFVRTDMYNVPAVELNSSYPCYQNGR